MRSPASADATEGRRELARHRVSAEYALPLALVVGETEDEMRRAAHAALAEFNAVRSHAATRSA